MLKNLRSAKSQMVSGEYVLLIALVAVAIGGMGLYIRRTLQARYRDSNMMAVDAASNILNAMRGRMVSAEYEPYYVNSISTVDTDKNQVDKVVNASGNMYYFEKIFDSGTDVTSLSHQAAPDEAH